MNRILALFALIALGGFLAILAFEVPSPDLIIVVIITAALALYDFYRSLFNKRD